MSGCQFLMFFAESVLRAGAKNIEHLHFAQTWSKFSYREYTPGWSGNHKDFSSFFLVFLPSLYPPLIQHWYHSYGKLNYKDIYKGILWLSRAIPDRDPYQNHQIDLSRWLMHNPPTRTNPWETSAQFWSSHHLSGYTKKKEHCPGKFVHCGIATSKRNIITGCFDWFNDPLSNGFSFNDQLSNGFNDQLSNGWEAQVSAKHWINHSSANDSSTIVLYYVAPDPRTSQ